MVKGGGGEDFSILRCSPQRGSLVGSLHARRMQPPLADGEAEVTPDAHAKKASRESPIAVRGAPPSAKMPPGPHKGRPRTALPQAHATRTPPRLAAVGHA